MNSKEFNEHLTNEIQKRILNNIKEINFIETWQQTKTTIPNEIVTKIWNNINWNEIIKDVSEKIQEQIIQTIIRNMITETKTDVKALLAVEGIRQKIRMEAYPKIKEILKL